MSQEGGDVRVPSERANAKLNNSELVSGVFEFEIANIEPVELESLSPGGAGDSGHFEINCHEIGGTDVLPEVQESGVEV